MPEPHPPLPTDRLWALQSMFSNQRHLQTWMQHLLLPPGPGPAQTPRQGSPNDAVRLAAKMTVTNSPAGAEPRQPKTRSSPTLIQESNAMSQQDHHHAGGNTIPHRRPSYP